MTVYTVRGPSVQPISLAEAKLHLRISTSAQDGFVAALIAAMCEMAQHQTNRQIIAARLCLALDEFPCAEIVIPTAPVLQVVSISYTDTAGVAQTLAPESYLVPGQQTPTRVISAEGGWPATRRQPGAVRITFDSGHAAPLLADTAANTIAVPAWPDLAVGAVLRLSNSGGALPAPLQSSTDYYVHSVAAARTYTLSTTPGGAAIDITTAGTGLSYLGEVPESVKAWMKLRMGALDANREEVGAKAELVSLPFADRLLDAAKVYL